MEQGLCKKCKRHLIFKSSLTETQADELIRSGTFHCHHDEPEKAGYVWKPSSKKPKKQCWCDNPTDVLDAKGDYWVTYWCPICGRKLNEDE